MAMSAPASAACLDSSIVDLVELPPLRSQCTVNHENPRSSNNNDVLETSFVQRTSCLTDKCCPLFSGEVVSLSHRAVHDRGDALLGKVNDVLAEDGDV